MLRTILAAILALTVGGVALQGGTSLAKSDFLRPYYLFQGSQFAVYASKHWRVEGAGPAKELEAHDRGGYVSKDRSFRVWANACSPGQKLTFTRQIDLLGRPSSVDALWDMGLATAYYDVFFNSKKVAHGSTNAPTFDAKDMHALRAGSNTIDVVIKLQSTRTACTNFQDPARRGVWFEIHGYFAADLRVGRFKEPDVYIDAPGGASQPMFMLIQALGSTVIPGGRYRISMTGVGWCIQYEPDGTTCKRHQFALVTLPTHTHGDITCKNDEVNLIHSDCTFEDLVPGEPIRLAAGVRFEPDPSSPDWVQETIGVYWSGWIDDGGPSDSDSSNNDNSVNLHFCRYGAGDNTCNPKPAS